LENNNDSILSVHTDGDTEYYSVTALEELGEIEHYILPKTPDDKEEDDADFFRLCTLFDFNFNKILTIRNFNCESTEIISCKDTELKTFTEANSNVCAITTNVRKSPLVIRSKNIVNVIIYDQGKKVVSLAAINMHQTLDKALKTLILELNIKYNSNPLDLKVVMISFGHSKVDVDDSTINIFKSNFHNITHCISQTDEGLNKVDICKINIATLLEVGVKYENIIDIKNKELPGILANDETVYTIINIK